MPIFFANKNDINLEKNEIKIYGDDFKHITKVLRYKENDALTICDGECNNYNCIIDSINDDLVLKIENSYKSSSEFPFCVNLYQGIAKGDKMDDIIQKATEMGIHSITPVETKFTIVKLSGDDKINKKLDRWNKIAREAAVQSERGIIPCVNKPIKFKDALNDALSKGIALICYGREDHYDLKAYITENNINSDNDKLKNLSFFIGPEGGFDISEIELANSLEIKSVSLGDSILRTETASIAFLSMLKYALM